MFGGMIIQVMTVFVVPMFQAIWREGAVNRMNRKTLNKTNNRIQDEIE